jgi:hypothetical protein
MGTIGHSKFVILDSVLLLLAVIVMNLRGLNPLLPLSPSGWMPFVTSWPLWLYWGSAWPDPEARREPLRFSVYSRDE